MAHPFSFPCVQSVPWFQLRDPELIRLVGGSGPAGVAGFWPARVGVGSKTALVGVGGRAVAVGSSPAEAAAVAEEKGVTVAVEGGVGVAVGVEVDAITIAATGSCLNAASVTPDPATVIQPLTASTVVIFSHRPSAVRATA